MNGVRTRKPIAEKAMDGGSQHMMNGNGKVPSPAGGRSEMATKENIFLFYPNLIGLHPRSAWSAERKADNPHLGYTRIILAVASLYYMPLHPRTCSLLYSISCLLDALDGVAARRFEQSTRFGAVLDMVTDRCTTACLLVFLSSAWPRWALLFQGLISLDLASHYMHMYATLTMAGSGQSHKKIDQSRSRLLYLYYNNKVCGTLGSSSQTSAHHV